MEEMEVESPLPQEETPPEKSRTTLKILLIAAVSIVLALMAFYTYYRSTSASKKTLESRLSIKDSIPKIPYTYTTTFYLLLKHKESEEEQLIRLDIVFGFLGINSKECFEKNKVLFRDVVYRFLKDQRPERNSVKAWTPIVSKDLRDYLQKNVEICKISSIYLESMERL